MAYNPNELFTNNLAGNGSGLRAAASSIQPKTFAAGSGTLEPLTPLMFNTATEKWVVWTASPATGTEDQLAGFVWPDAVVLDSDEEVLGNVMMSGIVHYDDIVLPDGESASDLKAALQSPSTREKGFKIQGLVSVR